MDPNSQNQVPVPQPPAPVAPVAPVPAPTPSPVQPPAPAPLQPQPVQPKKSGKKVFVIIGAALLLLIVMGAVGFFLITKVVLSSTAAPQKVSDEFMHAFVHDDPAAAYKLTSSNYREVTSESTNEELFHTLGKLALKDNYTITGKVVKSDNGTTRASFVYKLADKDNKDVYVRILLEKSSGTWQVDGFYASESSLQPTFATDASTQTQ